MWHIAYLSIAVLAGNVDALQMNTQLNEPDPSDDIIEVANYSVGPDVSDDIMEVANGSVGQDSSDDTMDVANGSVRPDPSDDIMEVASDSDGPLASHVPNGECIQKLKPNLLFIGQAYSGSTSLAAQMLLHPKLDYGSTKEHQYFTSNYRSIQSEARYKKYLEEFWVSCNATIAYDATMDYLEFAADPKHGIDAVKYVRQRLGGNLKIMAMFRDPVEILLHKACTNGKNVLSPSDPINGSRTISTGLTNWLKVFPHKSNWLFLSSDDYFAHPQSVLNKVFKFVGVEPMKLSGNELNYQGGRRRCKVKGSQASPEARKAYWSVKSNMDDKQYIEKTTGLHFQWHHKS